MKRGSLPALALLALCACGQGDRDGGSATQQADTLTRRQRDSLIATMPVPGASGVGRALDAQDASRERAAALDSILQGR